MPHRVPILATALLVLAGASLGGCAASTNLTAKRLQVGAAPEGVPLTLTKPVFVITETRATLEKPNTSYTLAVDYIGDDDQRFTVALSPAKFTEADLKLLLGDLGQLTELNSATRDQVAPTLKAIGSFLTKAVGAIATAAGTLAFLDQAPKQPEFFALVDSYIASGCAALAGCATVPAQPQQRCAALQIAWNSFKGRWDRLQQVELLFSVDDDEDFLLDVAKKRIACAEDTFRQALASLVSTHGNDVKAAAILDRFSRVVSIDDLDAALDELAKSTLADPIKLAIKTGLDQPARRSIANAEERDELALLARSWRHAHASYLEREIDRRQRRQAILESSPPPADATEARKRQDEIERLRSEVSDLRLQWARVIDAAEEYDRANQLRKVLSAMANRQQQPTPPARGSFADYEVAREELVALQVAITAKRAAVVPTSTDKKTPTPPPTRQIRPAVLWKLTGASTAAWVLGCLGANPGAECTSVPWTERPEPGTLPEFVVVVEKGVQP